MLIKKGVKLTETELQKTQAEMIVPINCSTRLVVPVGEVTSRSDFALRELPKTIDFAVTIGLILHVQNLSRQARSPCLPTAIG